MTTPSKPTVCDLCFKEIGFVGEPISYHDVMGAMCQRCVLLHIIKIHVENVEKYRGIRAFKRRR